MATSPPEPSTAKSIIIVKDAAFFRSMADTVLVVAKGSQTELCFIVGGPDPTLQLNADPDSTAFHPGAVRMQASLSDIGHVRIGDSTAADLVLNLASSLVERNIISLDELMENMRRIAKPGDTESAADDAENVDVSPQADAERTVE